MVCTFLMGGFGNAYFQIRQSSLEKNGFTSTIFLSQFVRRLSGQTNHINLHEEVCVPLKKKYFSQWIFLAIFIIDLLIVKIFHASLFTHFDTRRIKFKPKLWHLVNFGYFHKSAVIDRDNPAKIIDLGKLSQTKIFDVVYHYRAGDFVRHGLVEDGDYLSNALNLLPDTVRDVTVVTNDISHFRTNVAIPKNINISFQTADAITDLSILTNCKILIGSKSTFGIVAIENSKHLEKLVLPLGFKESFAALKTNCNFYEV